jgi:hypothetical protein
MVLFISIFSPSISKGKKLFFFFNFSIMAVEELDTKVKKIRTVADAKIQFLRDHMKLLDTAFEELKMLQEEELDLIYDKIKELEDRFEK